MRFDHIDWADCQIEEIRITADCAELLIWNDTFQEYCKVICTGLADLTNLCIWDDTIIDNADVEPATAPEDAFLISMYNAYGRNTILTNGE